MTAGVSTGTCLHAEEAGEIGGAVLLLVAVATAPKALSTSVWPFAVAGGVTEPETAEASLDDNPPLKPATDPANSQVLEAKQLVSVLFAHFGDCHTLLALVRFC